MEDRATSKDIRKLIREAISEFDLKDVADIREFINHKIHKTYTSGQLSGCFTNMCKSGELVNVERGTYRMGPGFEKRAGYYNKPKFIYEGTLLMEKDEAGAKGTGSAKDMTVQNASDMDSERFSRVKNEISQVLKQAAEEAMEKISEIRLGEIGVNDFSFIQELNELNETINIFCRKYGK